MIQVTVSLQLASGRLLTKHYSVGTEKIRIQDVRRLLGRRRVSGKS